MNFLTAVSWVFSLFPHTLNTTFAWVYFHLTVFPKVCAPRWKDSEHEVQGHIFMNGMCYESSKELDFNPSSPWPVLDNLRMQIHAHGHLVYGMGSVGTSVHYSKVCFDRKLPSW